MQTDNSTRRPAAGQPGGYLRRAADARSPLTFDYSTPTERVTLGAAVGAHGRRRRGQAGRGADAVLRFVVAGLALAALAAVIGQAIEQVGERSVRAPRDCCSRRSATCPSCSSGIFALRTA